MEIILGFILGLISSFIAWYILYHIIVPKIDFYPKIYKQKSSENPSGYRYVARIKNIGNRDIIDVEIFVKLRIKGLFHKKSLWKGIYVPLDDDRIPKINSQKNNKSRTSVQICISKIKPIAITSLPSEIQRKFENETILLEDLMTIGDDRELQIFIFGFDPFSGTRKMFESKIYKIEDIEEEKLNATTPNEPAPSNAGVIRRLAFTKPKSDRGKEKKQQVNPALRLPAGRYMPLNH